ncbi:MAG: type VI secretion system tube protein Hcp [Nitrosopumilus sp.]|nr:type VI secretion system tube protein Hcp [Nitrosopumilus sp.]MDH3384813.1 type VI secretion system tube protein Hcp [Nitrosopumilus sp.]
MTRTTNLLMISGFSVMFALVSASAEADAAIYVKIPGIEGDVTTEGYDNGEWFVADSFSFGVEREMKESVGKGGTQDINIGIGELQDVSISKSMDSASAQLAQLAINGNSCGTAEIDFVEIEESSGEAVPYLKYKLDRCFVKSWSISGDADDRPTEEVAFYYNKIAFAYTPQGEEKPKPTNIMSWDNVKNIPWDTVFDPIRDLIFPQEKSK